MDRFLAESLLLSIPTGLVMPRTLYFKLDSHSSNVGLLVLGSEGLDAASIPATLQPTLEGNTNQVAKYWMLQ